MEEYPEDRRIQRRTKEEVAIVLDFLPHGYSSDTRPLHRKNPVVQALGKEKFTLLELVPKKGIFIQPHEEVYIGDGKREKIHHIVGKLAIEKLTSTGNSELGYIVAELVHDNQGKFVEFFNNAQPLTTRMHQLELIPGLGKKHMWEILDSRKEKPFESFEDLKKRVKLLPDPEKAIVKRIIAEIEGKEKHRLFTE